MPKPAPITDHYGTQITVERERMADDLRRLGLYATANAVRAGRATLTEGVAHVRDYCLPQVTGWIKERQVEEAESPPIPGTVGALMLPSGEARRDELKAFLNTYAPASFAVGFYTHAEQADPVLDPGTDVDCPICTLPLDHPRTAIKTISVMPAGNRVVSCFYRVHKDCQEGIDDAEKGAFCATACEAALELADRLREAAEFRG